MTLLWDGGSEWTFSDIERTYEAIEEIALKELKLNIYPNQIDIISSEQMLDAYSSIGMPTFYNHWSFGKSFTRNELQYRAGMMGLAYEIVINSSPCLSYLMEENSMTMQALVMAHAACVGGDTEYLSEQGWKRIDQYDGGRVGQYNPDGTVNFVNPQNYIKRPQKDFIHVHSEKLDQAITDDHTVVFLNGNGSLVKITGNELAKRQLNKTRGFNGKFITGFVLNNNSELPLSNDEIRLHIAIKADGSIINPDVDKTHSNALPYYKIKFHLKKQRKIDRLETLLNNMGISYHKKETYGDRWAITFNYKKIDKRFGSEWYLASPEQLLLIGDEVCHWDGSLLGSNPNFSSEYKQDVDFVQFVWASTGYHAHIRYGTRAWGVARSPKVGISLSKHGKDGRKTPTEFERIPSEDGFAYCFTVDSGMFVIRRSNKISVTGNCGHNHVFKNNYVFKEWTDATSIVDYLKFAKEYIAKCEQKEGQHEVETFLDSCHAFMNYGVDASKRPSKLSAAREIARNKERENYVDSQYNELWERTIPKKTELSDEEKPFPLQPEENILWFCEKYAPNLPSWKREIIRIVRKISQYFYPQGQTQTLNEGMATKTHYTIMNRLREKGMITNGNYLEFIHSHTNVVFQPDFDDRRYHKINPYALGFAMLSDIERICTDPTPEDKEWFPDLIGQNSNEMILEAVANYRDESFISQFLSPKVMRDLRLFHIKDDSEEFEVEVQTIHNEKGYRDLRKAISQQYLPDAHKPNIKVHRVNKKTRELTLIYEPIRNRKLVSKDIGVMMKHMRNLWGGYRVVLIDDRGGFLGSADSL